jgi:SpoVK/Ycf46/Vps4 family AAA+-type ATPase
MSGKIVLTNEALSEISTGVPPLPDLSAHFPAELLDTTLSWEDLILEANTLSHIRDLETWLAFNDILLNEWQMKGRIKPGYRVLLHGPPGTGKTLTASLLGKYTDRPVYRIDLSTVVSKYIGETEKNLASLFDRAAHKNWILFFDEADSIFGKRTNVRDAHDKYANQEVSYLLQRIEAHPGLVLLATNFKDNIDDAFTRRFQSIIEFRMPAAAERLRLWELNIPSQITLADNVDMLSIARKYELSGSNITNIIQYCALQILKNNTHILNLEILMDGIRKEYQKENKMF